jgi:hypothetical protein
LKFSEIPDVKNFKSIHTLSVAALTA